MTDLLNIHATLEGYSRIDFDRRPVRKAMAKLGREVQKGARRRVARRAISGAGQYPGRQTGLLWRSIKYKVSKPGFLVRIAPQKIEGMYAFYPAFLFYGSRKRALSPRKNYMEDELTARRAETQRVLQATLKTALVPRK